MTSFHLRAIAAAASLLCASKLAWGQEPISSSASDSTAPPQAEATVVLMFDPHEDDSLALVGSIAAHLAGLPVRLIHEPRTRTELLTWLDAGRSRVKATRALGLFAIDVSRRDGWRLFFLEPDRPPTLIRRLKPTPEHAPLDEAGITVRLLVEGLLDGKHVEVTEPVVREEPADAFAPSSTRARSHVKPGQPSRVGRPKSDANGRQSAEAQPGESSPAEPDTGSKSARDASAPRVYPAALIGLSTTKWLSGQGWQSGIITGAAVYVGRAWSLRFDYVWYPKLRYQSSDAAFTLSRHPFTGQISYRPSLGFSPVFSLGAWFDAISRQTLETAAGLSSTASAIEPSWGLNGSLGFSSPRLSILSVRLDLGLNVAVRSVGYVVQHETAKTILATSAVQPFLGVVLDFRL